MVDRPLGPILHIIKGEAITQPKDPFIAKGAKVVTANNKIIGKLDFPIGRVDHPYQVIKLNKSGQDLKDGEFLIAKISKKRKKRKRSRNKR